MCHIGRAGKRNLSGTARYLNVFQASGSDFKLQIDSNNREQIKLQKWNQ